jgi:very-short-patch-repair endonuclease
MEGDFIDILDPEFLKGMHEYINWHSQIEHSFYEATPEKRWGIIRKIYERMTPEIIERGKKGILAHLDPYVVDWCKFMTPIEFDAWCSIRGKGLGLFAQYPVLSYFIDFANPYLKIGVELDGKDWHDAEKDRARDTRLLEQGWKIYRIKGSECYTQRKQLDDIIEEARENYEPEDSNDIAAYFNETSDGVFEALSIVYFNPHYDFYQRYYEYAVESLRRHSGVTFSIP